jgi:hypothetical protein
VIWTFKFSNGVKMFMWRAYNNLLPTKTKLF